MSVIIRVKKVIHFLSFFHHIIEKCDIKIHVFYIIAAKKNIYYPNELSCKFKILFFHHFFFSISRKNEVQDTKVFNNDFPWLLLSKHYQFITIYYRDRRVERQRSWPEALLKRLATLPPFRLCPIKSRNIRDAKCFIYIRMHLSFTYVYFEI